MRFATLGRALAAGALAITCASPVLAQSEVLYSTLGTFDCNGNGSVDGFSCGSGSLLQNVFVGYDEHLLPEQVTTPGPASLGFFDTGYVDLWFGSPSAANFDGTFFLTILQLDPTIGSSTYSGDFGGMLSTTATDLIWTPNSTVVRIGQIRYELTQQSYSLLAPNTSGGRLEVFANVSTVPEPGTIALLGTGLLALGGFGLKRRRQNAA